MNLEKTAEALRRFGYQVSVFASGAEADAYLNRQIDGKTVGIGGSLTLKTMGSYDTLRTHNQVYWHWQPEDGKTVEDMRRAAASAQIYLTSVNALSETGEMVNIDGYGNRLASTLYGHEKVYFVAGRNKIAPDLAGAVSRARNTAAPLRGSQFGGKTPCAADSSRCYDCASEDRICRAMVIYYRKMLSCDMEVVLIDEDLGL